MKPTFIHDAVLPQPEPYRQMALAQPFQSVSFGPITFHGIAPCELPNPLVHWIETTYPMLEPTLSFFRQSPAGQQEPHYVHTDTDMGDWTGLFYLTPDPPAGDGTVFYAPRRPDAAWDDETAWDREGFVFARWNRLLLFPADVPHSRALRDNYGNGNTARLIQVVFGRQKVGSSWPLRSARP